MGIQYIYLKIYVDFVVIECIEDNNRANNLFHTQATGKGGRRGKPVNIFSIASGHL